MKLKPLMDRLGLCPIYLAPAAEELDVQAAYCGDLLSDVLAHIPNRALWFTI